MAKIALVHDWLNSLGGAERVLVELHNIFPEAPIYTLFVNKKFTSQYLPKANIIPSSLQKVPFISKLYKYFSFLMPSIVESFDLSEYDIVLSSSVTFSKGLVLSLKTKHVCYCYSPTRFLWDRHSEYENKSWQSMLARHFLRIWDRQASGRVDEFVAISEHVKERIRKYYQRDAKVIYPPVGFKYQVASSTYQGNSKPVILNTDYYLLVSRLFPHKNIDIAIEAFNKLNLPLVIIGDGPEYKSLKLKVESKKIKLLGFVSDENLSKYYQNCKAFIMPQEEDFGLTPIEAMSYGKPVLALRKGGALETIVEGATGEFFDDPIPEALADGIRRLNDNYLHYNPETIKSQAEKFSSAIFRQKMLELVHGYQGV